MPKTAIGWTDVTWNPTTGCTKVSPGCKNCYAERISMRLKSMGAKKYQNGFDLTLHPDALNYPHTLKEPSMIFVNSMSDIFHEEVPLEFIQEIFQVIEDCPQHIFQILTKRYKQMMMLAHKLPWPNNLWMGVSVENQDMADERIPPLCEVRAKVRWLSVEPLLEPVSIRKSVVGRLYLGLRYYMDWVVVGGESGPYARPMSPDWARSIRDECRAFGIPFFMKQMGGKSNKRANMKDFPEDLRIQEYPHTTEGQ